MLKNLIPAMLIILMLMAALAACSGPTPDPTAAPTPTAAATPTETPAPTQTPTANPTAAPTATSASSPTPEPTTTPVPDGRLAPIQLQDSESLQSALSDAELACIGDDPEELGRTLTGQRPTSLEEQAKFIGCLNDETLARLFLAGFVPGPGPLSTESSECVRAAFDVINPREVMTAGLEGNPRRAMASSMAALSVTMACLNDEEWDQAAPAVGISEEERAQAQCLMAGLGGPRQMAEAMQAAGEGDSTKLAEAGAVCGLNMASASGQAPVTPTPTPTPTVTPTAASTATSTPTATPTRTPPTPAPTPANTLVITVAAVPADIPDYDRGDWKHWVDTDGDCQDARQEVLVAESLVAVTFETDRKCRVATGQWWAPHLGHFLENPSHIDVDHHVPLKNAHDSGGWRWNAATKEEYANYLGEENHLVAISSRHNRSKGARGPEEWAPPDNALWCDYASDWAEIKEQWGLTMTPVESEIVMDMLGTCENPPAVELEASGNVVVVPGEHKQTAEPENPVYGSCEEAAAAGEQRVQGSRGSGQGFPAEMVPSARDGDGDGMVCEK